MLWAGSVAGGFFAGRLSCAEWLVLQGTIKVCAHPGEAWRRQRTHTHTGGEKNAQGT